MRYHNITKADMLNGEGLRVVLWVSGCSHKCPGCHNTITWDPDDGVEFDETTVKEIFKELNEKNAKDDIKRDFIQILVLNQLINKWE